MNGEVGQGTRSLIIIDTSPNSIAVRVQVAVQAASSPDVGIETPSQRFDALRVPIYSWLSDTLFQDTTQS